MAFKSTDFKGIFVICRKVKLMNIKFCYRYRDGANYKQYNELVFANPNNKPLKEIELTIQQNLIDEMWFVADDWNIPNQFFDEYLWNNEVDHNWHEFDGVEETTEQVTEQNNIEEFLSLVQKTKLPW